MKGQRRRARRAGGRAFACANIRPAAAGERRRCQGLTLRHASEYRPSVDQGFRNRIYSEVQALQRTRAKEDHVTWLSEDDEVGRESASGANNREPDFTLKTTAVSHTEMLRPFN